MSTFFPVVFYSNCWEGLDAPPKPCCAESISLGPVRNFQQICIHYRLLMRSLLEIKASSINLATGASVVWEKGGVGVAECLLMKCIVLSISCLDSVVSLIKTFS